MFAMKLINTGEAARPFAIAFPVEANHHYFLATMGRTPLTKVFVFLKAHLSKIYE